MNGIKPSANRTPAHLTFLTLIVWAAQIFGSPPAAVASHRSAGSGSQHAGRRPVCANDDLRGNECRHLQEYRRGCDMVGDQSRNDDGVGADRRDRPE